MKAMLISDVGWCKAMKDAFAQLGLDVDALLQIASDTDRARQRLELAAAVDRLHARLVDLAIVRIEDVAAGPEGIIR